MYMMVFFMHSSPDDIWAVFPFGHYE
jgi:hypothetical protein